MRGFESSSSSSLSSTKITATSIVMYWYHHCCQILFFISLPTNRIVCGDQGLNIGSPVDQRPQSRDWIVSFFLEVFQPKKVREGVKSSCQWKLVEIMTCLIIIIVKGWRAMVIGEGGCNLPKKVVLITSSTPLSEQQGQHVLTILSVKPITFFLSYRYFDHFSHTLYNKVTVSDKIQSIVHLSHSSMRWQLLEVDCCHTPGDNLVTTTWGLCVCRLCKKPQSVFSAHAHALVTWWHQLDGFVPDKVNHQYALNGLPSKVSN